MVQVSSGCEPLSRDDLNEMNVLSVLQKHFPGEEICESHPIFISEEFLLAGALSKLSHRKEDDRKIQEFGKAIEKAWSAYSSLSLQAKKALALGDGETLSLPDPSEPFYYKFRRNLMPELVALYRAVHGRNPVGYTDLPNATRDRGMVKPAQDRIAGLPEFTEPARRNKSDQKIQLVETARSIWKQYKGKEAPMKGEGKFLNFVQDLILLAGKGHEKGWSAESAMEAWRKNSDALQKGEK